MRAGGSILLAALTLAGIAGAARGAPPVAAGRLALMPLPLSALGPAAGSLPVGPDSGIRTNADVAGNTNTQTTAKTFARLGRVTGYELDYADPAFAALANGKGLIEVDTAVDLYRDARSASAGLAFKRKDDLTVGALRSSMMQVSASVFTPAKVAGAGYGVMGSVKPFGIGAIYTSEVSFQHGPWIGSVSVAAAAPDGIQALTGTLAVKLAARITGVLAGKVGGSPVVLPAKQAGGRPPHGPDLAALTLAPGDFGSGKVTHQGYQLDNDLKPVAEYVRRMSPAGGFSFLESEVALFRTPAQARVTAALLIDTLASRAALEQALGTDFGGVKVTRIDVKPTRVAGRGQPYALLVALRLANGVTFSAAFTAVQVGKTMEFVTVFAPVGKTVKTGSLSAMLTVAARRLAGHGEHGSIA